MLYLMGGALGLVLTTVLTVFVVVRVNGVPEAWEVRLKQELSARGILIDYERLTLNARGHLVLEGARLLDPEDLRRPVGTIDYLECEVGWFSWWRGRSFVERLEVRHGGLDLPLGSTERMRVENLGARVTIEREGLRFERLEGTVLRFEFKVDGFVPFTAFHAGRPSRVTARPDFQPLWRQIREWDAKFARSAPVRLHARVEPRGTQAQGLGQMVAQLQLDVPPVEWRGLRFEGLTADGSWDSRGLRVPALRLRTGDGGELRAAARVDFQQRSGSVVLMVNGSPAFLAPLFSGWMGETLRATEFAEAPFTRAELVLDWREEFKARVLADLDWRDFKCRGSTIRQMRVSLGAEPGRVIVPELMLRTGAETLEGRLLADGAGGVMKGEVKGKLNLASFAGFLPEGMGPFFRSCDFANGADVELAIEGKSLKPGEWRARGRIEQVDGAYKGVAIRRLSADLETDGRVHAFRNVVLEKPEGRGTAAALVIDTEQALLRVERAVTRVNPQDLGHMIGGDFEKYLLPYRFKEPPKVEVEGVVDLKTGERTKVTANIAGGACTYPFLGRLLPGDSASTLLVVDGSRLVVGPLTARLYGGTLDLTVRMQFPRGKPSTLQVVAACRDMDFALAMAGLFKMGGVSGTVDLDAETAQTGSDMMTLTGGGRIAIRDGYLMSIPFLAGFSKLLNAIIPGMGYTVATSARAEYRIGDGLIRSDSFELLSPSHAVIGDFRYQFLKDALDCDARVNVRGIAGVLLFPVSKLFEYHGTGSLKDTKWGPKILGN